MFALVGCGETPRTEVVVFVRADPGVTARAERLDVQILGGEAGSARTERARLLYTGPTLSEGHPLAWPVRVALVPADGDAGRQYEVVATASDGAGPFVERRVVSAYLSRETLTLDVWLRDDCADHLCDAGQTCVGGSCRPTPVKDPCTLETHGGGAPRACSDRDATTPDTGAADASMDGGSDGAVDGGADSAVTDSGVADSGVADTGVADTGVADSGAPDPLDIYNVVFVTSTTTAPGALGGLAGADTICQDRAAAAGLAEASSYRALLPTSTTSAAAQLGAGRGWVRMDGLPFADRPSDIMLDHLYYPVGFLDTRAPIPAGHLVATGMNSGFAIHGLRCANWTDTGGFLDAAGSGFDGPGLWMNARGANSCAAPLALYCFGTARSVRLPAPVAPSGAGLAFVSMDTVTPSAAGIAAFDDLCAAEAPSDSAATFRAFVAPDNTTSAVSRFTFTGPWHRADGALVAETLTDLASQQLETPIAVTAGPVLSYGNWVIWTGAPSPVSTANSTCAGWTSTAGTGGAGLSGATRDPFRGTPELCGNARRILCLSDGPR